MASVKITELSNVLGSQINPSVDVLPIVRVGANSTDKITVEELGTLFGGGLEGSQYIYVAANGTDIENAAELQAAYSEAQMRLPTFSKRITIIAGPGNYNFESNVFTMDTSFIDLVSLDGNRSIVFNSANSAGTISITANDVFVKGVDVGTKQFYVGNNLNLTIIENCKGGQDSFASGGVTNLSGTFIDCEGGDSSFGSNSTVTVSGTFINCKAGNYSFGSPFVFGFVTLSGTFTNCTGGIRCFGEIGTLSGVFTNCTGGGQSFGGYFGSSSNVSGTFTNCTADFLSFGGGGTVSGVLNNCIAGAASFGGTLTGSLYYCRIITGSGLLPTVSGAGLTRYCLDGFNVANNQG